MARRRGPEGRRLRAGDDGTTGEGGLYDATGEAAAPGRSWALFVYDSGSNWTTLNAQTWSRPIDGQGNYTDIGDGYFAASSNPTPAHIQVTVQYGTPGTGSFVGGYVEWDRPRPVRTTLRG